jgi:hypothetical protein
MPGGHFYLLPGNKLEEKQLNIYLEIFGYIGTALVLISMMMTSVKWLRILNMSGAVISMIYAALMNTWPVAILNLGLIIIQSVQLWRLQRHEKEGNEA